MRTEFLCISVLRVASGPRVKLVSCKSDLKPRWLIPRLLCLCRVETLESLPVHSFNGVIISSARVCTLRRWAWYCSYSMYCFRVCVVMLALWSPSSIAAHFAFCFTFCVAMLAFWSPSTAAHFAVILVVIKSGIGT